VNLYAYAGNNPISYDDPFGLCPDSLKSKGSCPGGLSDKEYDVVEKAAKEHLKQLARNRILTALQTGKIRGTSFLHQEKGSEEAHVSALQPSVIRLNRSQSGFEGEHFSSFDLDSRSLAHVLAHEDRHVQQLQNISPYLRLVGGTSGNYDALQKDADAYADVNMMDK